MLSIGICIPTYCRGEITKQSILNIYNRNKTIFDEGVCHFYISDDCSKDDTFDILNNLKNNIKCITIKRNKKNLGFEGNNGECVKMCSLDYAWMLGDDDTINVDIMEIIRKIETNKDELPDFVVIGKNRNVIEKIYYDKNEAIDQLIYESTWMSGLIYKKSVIDVLNFERYELGEFPQTGAIFEYFGTHESSIQYIYGPNYASVLRPGVISYNDRILEIYAKGWTNLVMGLPLTYDYKIKINILKKRIKLSGMLSNRIIMSLRAQGYFDRNVLNEYYDYIKLYNRSSFVVLYLISVLPKKPLNYLRKLYAKILHIDLSTNG